MQLLVKKYRHLAVLPGEKANRGSQVGKLLYSDALWKLNLIPQVLVGDFLCGKVAYTAGKVSYTISCGGVVGSEVTVKGKEGNVLVLCEVEVMKDPTVGKGTLTFFLIFVAKDMFL